jgi:hypothetical protein
MNIEKKIEKILSEADVFSEPKPTDFPAPESIPTPGTAPGTYDPAKDASNISMGLKRLNYYLTMANNPAKFIKAMDLAAELCRKYPTNQKIAKIVNVIKRAPLKIMVAGETER